MRTLSLPFSAQGERRGVAHLLCVLVALLPCLAFGIETQVLPQGVFMLDVSYLHSTLDRQWSADRKAISLLEDVRRYEPGAGLQGILRARPTAEFDFIFAQLMYGLTDALSLAVNVPIVLQTKVTTNLSWEPGDYNSGLGRQYSEADFWGWAASMGQPRVPNQWVGNQGKLSDIILAARYLLPQLEWMKAAHFRWASTLQVALPTGTNADPEEVISAGTNLWELHGAGDAELHLAADQRLFVDENDVQRVNVGADVFYAFLRPREYHAGHGLKNPLLNNNAPYVGDTYIVDGGDWLGATVSVDVSPILGPTYASIVSGGSLSKAQGLPPLLTFTFGYTFIYTFASDWRSQSPLWDWDHEKYWQAGDKHIVRATATVSLMRLGLPVQLYATYRAGDLIPGRYTRPSNYFTAGARLIFKFW